MDTKGLNVVEHRNRFLSEMVAGGFLTKESAPSEEVKKSFSH